MPKAMSDEHGSEYYLKETARNMMRYLKAVRDEMAGDQEASPSTPAPAPETPKKAKPAKRAQPAPTAAAAAAVTDTQWNECQCSKFRNGEACPRDPDVPGYFVPNKSLTIVGGPNGPGKKLQLSQKCAADYAKIRPKRPKNPNGKKAAAAAAGADGETPAKKKKGVAPAAAAPSRNEEEEEEEVEQFADDAAEEGQVEHEEEVDV